MKFISHLQLKKSWIKSKLPWVASFLKSAKGWRYKLTAKVWPQKSIVFYTTRTSEQWTPESLKTGIGGSEGDVIYLAREWVKLGYEVTVYNNCGDKEDQYDGVQYLNYKKFNSYDSFDTLIVWRYPWMISFPIKAKRVWLDLHDVPSHQEFTQERLRGFDKVFVCSEYHKSRLPDHIPDDKIVIIPNGFDQTYLQWKSESRDPYKLIYASRYYRGLELMLSYGWPIIKREIPNAHLHIYHGWSTPDNQAERAIWKQKMTELMEQCGVTEHGRVGRETLIKEKLTAAIHYYGCTFPEIDCNSIRESAVVGCVPVTTEYAVFSEKLYCVKTSGNPYEPEVQEALAYQIVELLRNQERLESIRQEFQRIAKYETWDNIAKLWLDELD